MIVRTPMNKGWISLIELDSPNIWIHLDRGG